MNLTSDQVDAIRNAWLDLCVSTKHFETEDQSWLRSELAVACKDSVEELEKEFPFLMREVEDAS